MNEITVMYWQDPNFRSSLNSNTISTCKDMGITLNGFLNVEVADREAKEGEWILRIPSKPSTAELDGIELSEDELEKAAGGGTPAIVSAVTAVVTSVDGVIDWWAKSEDGGGNKDKGPKRGKR